VIRFYELLVSVPVVAYLIWSVWTDPQMFTDWYVFAWAAAVMVAELLPVPTNVSMGFSLSFPLQLAVALVYPVPVAAFVAFLGTSDMRELRRQIPLNKALFNRAQIAASVAAESLLFHADASLHSPWFLLVPAVFAATIIGYVLNAGVVATCAGVGAAGAASGGAAAASRAG